MYEPVHTTIIHTPYEWKYGYGHRSEFNLEVVMYYDKSIKEEWRTYGWLTGTGIVYCQKQTWHWQITQHIFIYTTQSNALNLKSIVRNPFQFIPLCSSSSHKRCQIFFAKHLSQEFLLWIYKRFYSIYHYQSRIVVVFLLLLLYCICLVLICVEFFDFSI